MFFTKEKQSHKTLEVSTVEHFAKADPMFDFRDIRKHACKLNAHNFEGARITVPSKLNILEWRRLLKDYSDNVVVEILQFGWPLNYVKSSPPKGVYPGYNHKSAQQFSHQVQLNIDKDVEIGALMGPLDEQPFSRPIICSPLQIVRATAKLK